MIRLFFRAALEEFPRAAVLDVVCHPLFRAPSPRHHWNLLARVLRISRGGDWRRLDRYVETGYPLAAHSLDRDQREVTIAAEEVAGLRRAISALMSLSGPDRTSWRDHAEVHRAALDEAVSTDSLLEDEAAVLHAIRGVLGSLSLLDRKCAPVSRQGFLDAFERECQRQFLENTSVCGVAVLDAMAVRGLAFRYVFLVGMNARLFPRFIVEEPFISDAVRREVFRVLGHHLAIRMDGYDEERLLFHLVRGTASERLVCVYQRADAKGRLRDPSPFLRPFLPLDRASIDAIPHAQSARRARAVVRTPREQILAASDTERVLAAFGARGGP
jgi:ATP-dependent helicase/nuclease subunit B